MRKLLRRHLPNRATDVWAMTIARAPGWVVPMGRPFQLLGGKTWTLSFIRTREAIKVEEFWKGKEN